MPGRSIRLFLIDGTPHGMRTAEVGNWTGLALVCPRTDLVRLGARFEARRTGVYILVGTSETSADRLAVYVGEGDEVWSRLTSHDDSKDFWTFAVIFVSKDENLTKAHVRWLESRLVSDMQKAKRAEVKNGNSPGGNKLPDADVSDMETFYENVRLLLPTLGVTVFGADAGAPVSGGPKDSIVLELKWEDARARCLIVNGQFVVQEGSTARAKQVDSLSDGLRSLRKALREEGVLEPLAASPNLLRFTQDYAFDSVSTAAGVVAGTGLNGRAHWKLASENITYKEWQERQVRQVDADGEMDRAADSRPA